jgi:hypothetical protein
MERTFSELCSRNGLNLVKVSEMSLDLAEEFENVEAVGFQDDPSYGAAVAFLGTDGHIRAVTRFADGRRCVEDRVEEVDPATYTVPD